jgi:hypothetical protein
VGDRSGRPCCKIGRDCAKYDLPGLNENLCRRRADGASLRDLREFVNERVLERALADADVEVVGDPENIHRLLGDEEVSAGRQAELRSRLQRAGVDIESVEKDFVSHQTVRAHLKDCLDVDTSRRSSIDTDRATRNVNWAKSRSKAVIERTLDQLRNAGHLSTDDLDVTQTVRVTCTGCGETYRVADLLDRGGCECGPSGRSERPTDES